MKMKFPKFPLIFFLLLGNIQPSFAFKIEPISRIFTPTGSESTQSYDLVSDKPESQAVEMSVVKREMDLDGNETYIPADDDFLIYPPQVILKAGTTQTVRVTWVGEPDPKQELAYRLVSQQIPINLKKPEVNNPTTPLTTPKAQVEILIKYMGSLYVRPADVQPKVVLESIIAQTDKGKPAIAMILDNQGSGRASLANYSLNLTSAGKTVILKPDQLKEVTNQNILANHKRRFIFPHPADLPQGTVTATFDYTP
jgi:fimbrial chaperone protein